jgi:hypothetical protein
MESNSDVILVKAMKNCSSGKMIWVYQKLIDRLHAAGIVPKHHIPDNKCSDKCVCVSGLWLQMGYCNA